MYGGDTALAMALEVGKSGVESKRICGISDSASEFGI